MPYLEVIIGPMFSGKTSRLVEIYNQCVFCNISCLVLNHQLDNAKSGSGCENILVTHNSKKIPCTYCDDTLMSTLDNIEISKYDVILINEGQFFSDLYISVEYLLNSVGKNTKIYVCGLDGDFKREKFGQILDIIPICDSICKLNSLCAICRNGTFASFTKRITDSTNQTLIGDENYIPVCRNCYGN